MTWHDMTWHDHGHSPGHGHDHDTVDFIFIWWVITFTSMTGHNRYIEISVTSRHHQSTGSWTWVDRTSHEPVLWLGQRVRPTSERLAGQLGCLIPPFLSGTRHPCLVTCHSHQERNMTTRRLRVNYQCIGLYPGLQTSPHCNTPAPPTYW